MARVSIEERAAAAAKKLARTMGWSRPETIGKLYQFWHDSQELEQTHCTLNDILLWMEIEPEEDDIIAQALIDAGFIEPVEAGQFLICGNAKHIENLRQRRDAAKAGGARSAEVRLAQAEAKRTVEANGSTVRLNQTQASDEPSSLQFSALQCSAVQKEEDIYIGAQQQKIGGQIPQEEVASCVKAWEGTLEHFKIKRPVLPHENMAIAQLIKGYGHKATLYALTGARFETKTDNFDPAKNVAIQRLQDPKLFNKFLNLAAQKKASGS